LLFDLLTEDEIELRFDIDLLAQRLVGATDWTLQRDDLRLLPIGYFGASTGAAAALIAAAARPWVSAIVSRGGRPDLARPVLSQVRAPTLLVVGGNDRAVLEMNRSALRELGGIRELSIVPDATHLFEEQGALESVATLATDWFTRHLRPATELHAVP